MELTVWRTKLKAACAPPDHGGNADVCREVVTAYRVWRREHTRCQGPQCARVFVSRRHPRGQWTRYCSRVCSARALAEMRRKHRLLAVHAGEAT